MTPKALVFIVSAHTRDAFASTATIPPFAGELYQCLPKGMSWQPSVNPLLQIRFETLDSWFEKVNGGTYAPSTHIPILTTRTDITFLEPRYEGLPLDVLAGAFIPMGEWNYFLFYDLPTLLTFPGCNIKHIQLHHARRFLLKAHLLSDSFTRLDDLQVDFMTSPEHLRDWLEANAPADASLFGMDIEGGGTNPITCFSMAFSNRRIASVQLRDVDTYEWLVTPETAVEYARILFEFQRHTPFVAHWAMYEMINWMKEYNFPVHELKPHCTLSLMWEWSSESKRNLGIANALFGNLPYWKYLREGSLSAHEYLLYNAYDSYAMLPIFENLWATLEASTPASLPRYELTREIAPWMARAGLDGIPIDNETRKTDIQTAILLTDHLQKALGEAHGIPDFNINSTADKAELLFQKLGFKAKPTKKGVDAETGETLMGAPSTSKDALYALMRPASVKPEMKLTLKRIIRCCEYSKAISNYNYDYHDDGRIRFTITVDGTKTGRHAVGSWFDGCGKNVQTVSKTGRDVASVFSAEEKEVLGIQGLKYLNNELHHFMAPEGYRICQVDLAGADAWTLAARLALLGCDVLLEDLRYGLKPALIILYMFLHGNNVFAGKSRAEIKAMCKSLDTDGHLAGPYRACKVVWYGGAYGLSPDGMSNKAFKDTEGVVDYTANEFKKFWNLLCVRYWAIPSWVTNIKHLLQAGRPFPRMTCPSGQTRSFMGPIHAYRPVGGGRWKAQPELSPGTVNQACSQEPQSVTTHIINRAYRNLITDPANRYCSIEEANTEDYGFLARPLFGIHDSLITIFRSEFYREATRNILSAFNVPITYYSPDGTKSVTVLIPYEGKYGRTLGEKIAKHKEGDLIDAEGGNI